MAGIAIVHTTRQDLGAKKDSPKGQLASLVIDFAANGGGTVRCIHKSEGPFGGEPKSYAFESPESLNQFVAGKILGTKGQGAANDAPADDAPPEGGEGMPAAAADDADGDEYA